MRSYDLKQREVIDIVSAERLGYVHDLDVDYETGKITAIIVPGKGGIFRFFSKPREYIIRWDRIVAIGREIILVRLDELEITH